MSIEKNTLIWLNSLGVHSDILFKLTSYLGNISKIHNVDLVELNKNGLINSSTYNRIRKSDYNSDIEQYLDTLKKQKIKVMTIFDDCFPKKLLEIPDIPYVLYYKGDFSDEDLNAIAIVGSRKATAYGKWAAEKFSKELVEMGITVVSGMAVGIDTVSHRTALEFGGRTIGVLGNGLDSIYPRTNKKLFEDTINNGALVSEFSLGTKPLPFHFPMRNRIISGLSLGVIVIEAKKKSGSLITAHHAASQGKDVFAIPGNINSLYSEGTNLLIKDGVKPLLDMDDILEEIHELQLLKTKNTSSEINDMDLSQTEKKVLNHLVEGPIHSDIIVLRSGLDIQTVISTLTILELKGIIKEMSSRIFTIV